MLEAKAVTERDAAARALAALVVPSGYRKLFKKDERGIVNVVQLQTPASGPPTSGSRCRCCLPSRSPGGARSRWWQLARAGSCSLQGLLAAEVDGTRNLADSLGRGKMLSVFPRA